MIYRAKKGQISYGERIGILMLETYTPFIPGDVGNATTFSYPVRYKTVPGLTVKRILAGDSSLREESIACAWELVEEGVMAITGDCGYMILFQEDLSSLLPVPVFLSSLLQIPFLFKMLSREERVGILCASKASLTEDLLLLAGITREMGVVIRGLEEEEGFHRTFIQESGVLDTKEIEEEVVAKAQELKEEGVKAILLECSVLPPYAHAIQRAVQLPVFDYTTMIEFVYSGLVRTRFSGFL